MRRWGFIVAVAVVGLAAAHAQSADGPDMTKAVALAMTEALAPVSHGSSAYRWDAVSIRVSRHVRWHLVAPDRRDRPVEALVARNGWISSDARSVEVTAIGGESGVRQLVFQLRDGEQDGVIVALRAGGAVVESLPATADAKRYEVTPSQRRAGILSERRICTPDGARSARSCHVDLTLALVGS